MGYLWAGAICLEKKSFRFRGVRGVGGGPGQLEREYHMLLLLFIFHALKFLQLASYG